MKLRKTLAALTLLSLTAACAQPVVSGSCGKVIVPSEGFEARWTRAEKEQVVAHNETVWECRD